MTEFGISLPDGLVIENIGIMLTDMTKFLHYNYKAYLHWNTPERFNGPNFRFDPNIKLKFSVIHFGSSIYYKAKADFQMK